ncbi:MAG: ATPase [Bacillales bacterium]|jgi:NadR type nicotinamide-nucleotide adenylyltransferase|nr:ATPase [Bacillales bacterium]
MTKKILIIGAESTGKSTLTNTLFHYYECNYKVKEIQEFAREFIDEVLDGDMKNLKFEHITFFGQMQMMLVRQAEKSKKYDLIFSDTDAIVSSVFQEVYYKKVDKDLLKEVKKEEWDLVLFTQPDIPWVNDGQRDLGHRRQEINRMFKATLHSRCIKYVEISGDYEDRIETAIKAVDSILTENNSVRNSRM